MVLAFFEDCGDDAAENPAGRGYPQDLKPEYCVYTDDGCQLARSCLQCPFEICVYDAPVSKRRGFIKLRNKEIIKFFKSGRNEQELAEIFRVNLRTIYRVINRKMGNRKTGRKRGVTEDA